MAREPGTMQIGEVAARTGLSLRTIRWYEEVGLIGPTTRSPGGFRHYSEADVERLRLIMQMKPLDFSLEEMRDLLSLLDALLAPSGGRSTAAHRRELAARLAKHHGGAVARVQALRDRLAVAEGFAARLEELLAAATTSTRSPTTSGRPAARRTTTTARRASARTTDGPRGRRRGAGA